MKIEEVKLGKMFNDYGEKDIDRYEKYERYEQYEGKSRNTARKLKEKLALFCNKGPSFLGLARALS